MIYTLNMNGYITNIGKETLENTNFRKVLYTSRFSQLVVMHLNPGEEIGEEVHQLDQFLRIEAGRGKAILDGVEYDIAEEFSVSVPAGARHNIINTSSDEPMKLYTIYSPPEHRDGTVHATKADAMADENDHYQAI